MASKSTMPTISKALATTRQTARRCKRSKTDGPLRRSFRNALRSDGLNSSTLYEENFREQFQ
jgi:hypothetical protein